MKKLPTKNRKNLQKMVDVKKWKQGWERGGIDRVREKLRTREVKKED